MTRRPLTPREQREHSDAYLKMCAAAVGKVVPPGMLNNLPPKRVRTPSLEPKGHSESEILKAIMQLLRHHPKVGRVWRQNSGTFQMGERRIRANTARGMSDIMGILKNGRTLAIEVKTATGRIEDHQLEFLRSINDAGGLGFVARSVDDVVNRLRLLNP